jgi:hypothetical protein
MWRNPFDLTWPLAYALPQQSHRKFSLVRNKKGAR